ncbi:hypothetical protein KP509_1Z055100 [Ceratopteris richardii]|nr:hypothetical protein KP509_1Z055100 [Ceratopteris richardii]
MDAQLEQQDKHWRCAQSLELGIDLIVAARSQLRFLSDVDSNPADLYRGPAVQRAISRYENLWLPLLAERGPYTDEGLPLIPPLDCAWIWHCHRLNPVQYLNDCKACYGKLLDATIVSTETESEAVAYTRKVWDSKFPDDNYDFTSEDLLNEKGCCSRTFKYDLQAAVERQSSFYYQVSRPHMEDPRFLKAALQRYKGFLYLLKLSGLRFFLVPTYDIDLMWHSHQANPGVYGEDTMKLLGRVLNHDDTDSDRSEGQKLDTGFTKTIELWKQTYGSSYKKAGAMYRGEAPFLRRPFRQAVHDSETPRMLQVFVTVEKVRNLQMNQDGFVAVRVLPKNKSNLFNLETSWLKGAQDLEWNHFWCFDCEEATQGICFELRSEGFTCWNMIKKSRQLGWIDISWQTLLSSETLSFDGWLPLLSKVPSECDQKPVLLRVSISVTPPVSSSYPLRMGTCSKRDGKGKVQNFFWPLRNSGSCDGGGCGGCGAGGCKSSSCAGKRNLIKRCAVKGGGCGGCGAGGCGNNIVSADRNGRTLGGKCGGCGAGGCGNKLRSANPEGVLGSGCGGCGAGACGGCGSGGCTDKDPQSLGAKCGGCGAGGCGNNAVGTGKSHQVQGAKCGGCGAGGCGNDVVSTGKSVQGRAAACGGCGAGACGNNTAQPSVESGGCGACGAGGCGNDTIKT